MIKGRYHDDREKVPDSCGLWFYGDIAWIMMDCLYTGYEYYTWNTYIDSDLFLLYRSKEYIKYLLKYGKELGY